MKRYPIFSSILLFVVAVLGFLFSEVRFFFNPMYGSGFIDLYLFPLFTYLLSLIATVGLSRIEHGCVRGLLLALAFFVCIVMIGVNAGVFAEGMSLQCIYYPYNLSLWFSLPLLVSAALTTALAYRAHAKRHPRLCCALLFVLAVSCALLAGCDLFFSPRFGEIYPGWYLGQLLLYALAVAATIALHRIEHACTKGLLIALACIATVAAIGAILWTSIGNAEIMAKVYPNNLLLWLSLPLLVYAVFAGVLAGRSKRRDVGTVQV